MKIQYSGGNSITLIREPGDKKFRNTSAGGWSKFPGAAGESALLYALKKKLQALGMPAIKKPAWKDGGMVDESLQWVRLDKARSGFPHVAFFNAHHAVYGSEEDWNANGKTTLAVHFDLFGKQSGKEGARLLAALLAKKNPSPRYKRLRRLES